MSRYDDPRRYEENYPDPVAQNCQDQSLQFEDYSLLPTSQDDASGQDHKGQPPSSDRHSRFQRVLEQVLLIAPFVIIAFWGGWFCHEFSGKPFNQSNPSKADSHLIQEAWNKIDQNYVDRKEINYKKMAYTAINAMVQTLGDSGHSRFMNPQEADSDNQQLKGRFTGIGIYLHQDPKTKQLTIDSTIPGSPAEKAGFKQGDTIVAIDGVSMKDKDVKSATNLIHGQAGTSLTITIQRPDAKQPRDVRVTRAEIQISNVNIHYIRESHIAHIQIAQFTDGVSKQLRDVIKQAKNMGATKIILDLRNNPGGYLQEAVDTASLFIKNGNVLLEQDSSGKRTAVPANGNSLDTSSQIIILVNGNTASAAEIVSGALKDSQRAVLLGQKTFGTGTVLEPFTLSDKSVLYLGTKQWLTPNGHFIRQNPDKPGSGGINPDITVLQASNATTLTPTYENQNHLTQQQILDSGDTQLSAAIHYLTKK